MRIDVELLAYLAGIVDGEGCIMIARRRNAKTAQYSAMLKIGMTEQSALDAFAKAFGGQIRTYDRKPGKLKPIGIWGVGGKRAGEVCQALQPYLRVKKSQAVAVIELCKLQAEARNRRTRKLPRDPDILFRCEHLHRFVKGMNGTPVVMK